MNSRRGEVVLVLAGREKGMRMAIVGVDDAGRLLLANGRQRKIETPKRKQEKHTAKTGAVLTEADLCGNRRLYRALLALKASLNEKG